MSAPKFYAFALNEFRWKRISFTVHRTRKAAETSAYQLSGQRGRWLRGADACSAESDLTPHVMDDAAFFRFIEECGYGVDWKGKELISIPEAKV